MRRRRPPYRSAVAGIPENQLPEVMKNAYTAVQGVTPPHTGIAVFLFDFGEGGGLAYISNGKREDCVKMLREWLAKTDPQGEDPT